MMVLFNINLLYTVSTTHPIFDIQNIYRDHSIFEYGIQGYRTNTP